VSLQGACPEVGAVPILHPSQLAVARKRRLPLSYGHLKKEFLVFVAASTECFSDLSLPETLERLADLEYTSVEISIREHGQHLRPSEIAQDVSRAVDICRNTRRLDVVAYNTDFSTTGQEYYDEFQAICRLAKATKVITVAVASGELGTPFNEEVERLRKLVAIATHEGVRVGIRSQLGRLSEDPDTVTVLCDNVEGLGLTLDPSHYLIDAHRTRGMDKLYKYVIHVHLRDSTKDKLQVRVGQGEVEYGRLIANLRKFNYSRALCVNVTEMPDVDHMAEMRKMRLLLESLL
jgi:sugar phosphate isomerase/epimerase